MTTNNEQSASTPQGGEATTTAVTGPLTEEQAQALYLERVGAARKEFEASIKSREGSKKDTSEPKGKPASTPQEDDEDEPKPRVKLAADDDVEDDEDEAPKKPAKEEDEDAEGAPKFADDEASVKIKVGDEEHVVPVKDLKRLFGQESALTKRSQEIALAKKDYEGRVTKTVTALEALTQRARTAFEPYSKINWPEAAKRLSTEDYNQLRQDAQDAHSNLKYLVEELDGTMKGAEEYTKAELKKAAKAASDQLSDQASPHYIENWSKQTYDSMREFAVSSGLDGGVFDNIVDPAALKIVHDAMSYRAMKAKTKEVVTKAKAKVVSDKQLKPAPSDGTGDDARDKAAMARLQKSGSTEDAMAVWLARQQSRRSRAAAGG